MCPVANISGVCVLAVTRTVAKCGPSCVACVASVLSSLEEKACLIWLLIQERNYFFLYTVNNHISIREYTKYTFTYNNEGRKKVGVS